MYYIRDLCRFLPSILISVILLACCSEYAPDEYPFSDGSATLSLNLSIPEVEVTMKSVSSDPFDPSEWTAWERAVDGRYLYRVTAFLIKDNRLVSSKDLQLTGEPTEAVLEFDGNFTHGAYTLMVVANYSAHNADDGNNGMRNYGGLEDFTATVESILEQNSIDNFTSEYEDSFIKYELESHDGICAKVPQALTMVKDIELHPGINVIEGDLVRTYSRIRIAAENQSDEVLKISSLTFCNVFTQKKEYLFTGNGYIQDKVSLDVDSPYALTAFTATEDAPLSVAGKETCVIFDAYILESSRGSLNEEYSYSLSLGYDGTKEYKLRNTNAINRRNSVSSGYYIIYNTSSDRYLTAGSNSVLAKELSTLKEGMSIPKEYVWTFDKGNLSSYEFYIGTSEIMSSGQTSYYMNSPSSANVGLSPNRSIYFTVTETSSFSRYYLNFTSSEKSSKTPYIRVSDNNVTGTKNTGATTRFYLYPVEQPKSASSTFKVPLETIDKTSGQPVLADKIERNDFIDAIVLVKYNKNKGHFEFEVKNWNTAGGDIEFN